MKNVVIAARSFCSIGPGEEVVVDGCRPLDPAILDRMIR